MVLTYALLQYDRHYCTLPKKISVNEKKKKKFLNEKKMKILKIFPGQ